MSMYFSLAGVEPEPFEQGDHLVTASGRQILLETP